MTTMLTAVLTGRRRRTRLLQPAKGMKRLSCLFLCVTGTLSCVSAEEWRERVRHFADESAWTKQDHYPELTRNALIDSIEAARVYLLNQQKPEGNFRYEYDIVLGRFIEDDNAVRQAGTLWSLASLVRDRPTQATRNSVVRGLDFFFRWSRPLALGRVAPVYPETRTVKTGTVALVSLALIDFMRGQEVFMNTAGRGFYDSWLTKYLDYLTAMELETGSWGGLYDMDLEKRIAKSSPYYDGECLLAYCRAARYSGRDELIPRLESIAPLLAEKYTVEAWKEDVDSDETKGFFQWGAMAFAEYAAAGWKDADTIAETAYALAWWCIHEHRIEIRNGNTGYAVEGLLAVEKLARDRGDTDVADRLAHVSSNILSRLITWQFGGPFEDANPFFKEHKEQLRAFGGIMNRRNSGIIRIDVVQHQLHAMLMALNQLFPEEKDDLE